MATAEQIKEKCKDFESTVNYIVEEMCEQNCRSQKNGACKYRHQENEKILSCAIGKIIPDEIYDEILEESSMSVILGWIKKSPDILTFFYKKCKELVDWWKENLPWVIEDKLFFYGLQSVHDSYQYKMEMLERVEKERIEFKDYFRQEVQLMLDGRNNNFVHTQE